MPEDGLAGLFWDDTPIPKPPKKQQEKRTPPEQTWLDHLPGLEEARAFPVELLSYDDLVRISQEIEELIVDVEVFSNYFLAVFTHVKSGKVFWLDSSLPECWRGLRWILENCLTVGFNSLSYDLTICYCVCAGMGWRIKDVSVL